MRPTVHAPNGEVWELPLLTESERRQLLVESMNTEAAYPRDQCFHQLFAIQTTRTPDRTAVVYLDVQLTYAEIDRRANQLARYLRTRGVGPDVVVGIYMHRSIEMVVGILGILKAGGAYLPLEPSYPSERLSFMIDDAGTSLVLTQECLRSTLRDHDVKLFCVDSQWPAITKEREDPPDNLATPLNLAYIIYTSGSTGRPKGVMITHSGLVNYLSWCTNAYDIEAGSGSLVHSPLGFDLTVTSLLAPLMCGQRVTLLPEEDGIDGLSRALSGGGDYSLLKITPSHLEGLSYSLAPEAAANTTRALIIGGDALFGETLEYWRRHAPHTRLINEYGPTETVVGCCVYEVGADEEASGVVPIGRPIANTQAYVLDDGLQVAPIGVAGELYIGGAGVARGYVRRPDLTAERFLPDPFTKEPGARFYKTGDRARYRSGGTLEFLGRVDHQVKIRGHRIELGEIETALTQHPSVRECVVIARDEKDRAKELVAYVVPKPDTTLSIAELQSSLSEKLPQYMVPSAFVTLETLPLTSNGKLDRRALPAPELSRADMPDSFVGPGDPLEVQLVKTWEKVLARKPIGIRDNFFALGGDSLLAVRLFTEIEKKFDLKLPLSTLFEAGTISQLAEKLRTRVEPSWSSLVAIQPQGSKPPLFCIHACGAHVFIYRPLVNHLGLDQPVYGLQAQGIDGSQTPYTRIEDMAAHYIKEIRELEPHGPYYLTGDTLGGLIAFEIAQQLTRQGESVAFLAMFDTFCPLPLSFGPRLLSHFRHLKQLGPKEYVRAATRSLAARLGIKGLDHAPHGPLSSKEQDVADAVSMSGDAVQRTEWGIYLATHVNYRPPPERLPGRITYFLARDTRYASGEVDNRLNWKRGAADFEVNVVPGRHDTISSEPFVALLAEKFISCLSKAHERDIRFTKQSSASSP